MMFSRKSVNKMKKCELLSHFLHKSVPMATLAANAPRNALFQTMEKTANITANVSNLNAIFHTDVSRKRQPLITIKVQVCIDLE